MIKQNEILNSKISVPGIDRTIQRERLKPYISAVTENKITVVTAGTGYGKSTFAAHAVEISACAASWYRIEESDKDPVTFINYLIAGIRKTYSDFGRDTLKALSAASFNDKSCKNNLSLLVNEIDSTISCDFIIVLDDCHEVADNTEITNVLQFLADYLPERIHIIMTSRVESTLLLSRHRAGLDVNEVLQEELEFNADEVTILYHQLFGYIIPKNILENLLKQTEGWISGLILFYHLAKGKTPVEIEKLLAGIKSNHKIFKEYMGENVFEQQADEIKKFLLETSVFKCLESEFCNSYMRISNSTEILNMLADGHFFTIKSGEKDHIYTYHNMLREFLTARILQEKGTGYINDANKRVAELFESHEREEDALYHYLQGGYYEEVFRLLKRVGNNYFIQGRRNLLNNLLEKIPQQFLQTEPWPLAFKAKLLMSEGSLVKSAECSRKACKIFLKRGMDEDAGIALMDLGRTQYLSGDFIKARQTYEKILDKGKISSEVKLEILSNQIFITSFLGLFDLADNYYEQAGEIFDNLSDNKTKKEHLLIKAVIVIHYGFRWTFSGDFVKSLLYADSVYDEIKRLDSSLLTALYYQLASVNYLFLGKIELALKNNNRGLREVTGEGFYGTVEAWLRLVGAAVFMTCRNYESAEIFVEKGMQNFKKGGSKWGEASMLIIKAALSYKTGEIKRAFDHVRKGLEITHDINLPWVRGKLLYYSAIEAMINKRFNDADSLLTKSESILKFSLYEQSMLKNVRTKFYYLQGEEEKALESLKEALKLGETYTFGTWLFYETGTELRLFLKVYAEGLYKSYITGILYDNFKYCSSELKSFLNSKDSELKLAASEIIIKMPETTAPSLGVCCLGDFRVFVGDREVLNSEWKSRKARDILKYLVMSGSQPVHKDVLLELLWPEQDAEITLKRLHVALPALRKALEPDAKRGESSYLIRENDHYRIELGEGGFFDVDLFNNEIKKAHKERNPDERLKHLLQAEKYYTGDFLEQDLYLEWCFEEREYLKQKYLESLDSILDLYEMAGDSEKCILYSEKYLNKDPYSEKNYLKLMKYYFEIGNFELGLKTYEKCYDKVVRELDTPLSTETLLVYEKLLKTEKFISGVYK